MAPTRGTFPFIDDAGLAIVGTFWEACEYCSLLPSQFPFLVAPPIPQMGPGKLSDLGVRWVRSDHHAREEFC